MADVESQPFTQSGSPTFPLHSNESSPSLQEPSEGRYVQGEPGDLSSASLSAPDRTPPQMSPLAVPAEHQRILDYLEQFATAPVVGEIQHAEERMHALSDTRARDVADELARTIAQRRAHLAKLRARLELLRFREGQLAALLPSHDPVTRRFAVIAGAHERARQDAFDRWVSDQHRAIQAESARRDELREKIETLSDAEQQARGLIAAMKKRRSEVEISRQLRQAEKDAHSVLRCVSDVCVTVVNRVRPVS